VSLPERAVRAYLQEPDEMPAALRYAERCGLHPSYDQEQLRLLVPLTGPGSPQPDGASPDEDYLLEGRFDDYRVLPPVWHFLDPRTQADVGIAGYPTPIGPSVLHGQGLICAHFSRKAYSEHGGPHANWHGPPAWQWPVEGTQAFTISDMLARLIWETQVNSQGRMAPLP
jgi:hypothetical protein